MSSFPKTTKGASSLVPLIDIGCNLLDPMFRGNYRGKQQHTDDFRDVLERGYNNGIEKIIVTAGTLQEAKDALVLARTDPRLFATIGVHPTRCSAEFLSDKEGSAYLQEMVTVATQGKQEGNRVAVHCRAAGPDMVEILTKHGINKGVVHSFDGSLETMQEMVNLGLSIGINGCSLRTEANLNVVKQIPSDRLLLETDGPWCDVRPSHPGYKYIATTFESVKKAKKWVKGKCVKSRQEP
jgi:TatD DNase family protein